MAGPPHNSGLCTPIYQKQCLIKEGPRSLEGSAGIQKDRAMGQGSGVISLHGRFRAHGPDPDRLAGLRHPAWAHQSRLEHAKVKT